MKRKGFIVIMLALCILMCISIVGCGGGENPGDNPGTPNGGEDENSVFEFELNEDNTYILVGMGACTDVNVVIPSTYNSLPVTHIYSSAFENNTEVESIFIPEFVEDVDTFGFDNCTKLKNIYVDEKNATYTSIDGNLYKKNPMSIELYAPGKTATEFTIPEGVKEIGSSAFSVANPLKNIYLPETVEYVIKYAFSGSKDLQYSTYGNARYLGSKENPYLALINPTSANITTCEINESTRVIGEYAFEKCESIKEIIVPDSVVAIGGGAFSCCSGLESIVLSRNIKTIEDQLFYECTSLVAIEIPEGVTYIGDAFNWCENLMSISIPSSLVSVSDGSMLFATNSLFYNTYEDGSYLGNSENPYVLLVKGGHSGIIHRDTKIIFEEAFMNRDIINVTIPDNVISIGAYAFSQCNALEEVTIGSGVTCIGDSAFEECISLKSIAIPDNVLELGTYVFDYCELLEEVIIGKGISKLPAGTFNYCSALKAVEIPGNIEVIEKGTFRYCTALTEITIPKSVKKIGNAFYQSSIANIIIDNENEFYKSVDGNLYTSDGKTLVCYAPGKTAKEFTVPSGVYEIGARAFYGNSYLESVVVSDGVVHIIEAAFQKCASLKSVTLANSVKTIGMEAFGDCAALKNVVMSSGIRYIAPEAFEDTNVFYNEYKNAYYLGNEENPYIVLVSAVNKKITSCEVSEDTRIISSRAFTGCEALIKLSIPLGVCYIGRDMCRNTPYVTIYCAESSKPTSWSYKWNSYGYDVEWSYNTGDDFFEGDQGGTGVDIGIVGSEITKEQWEQMRNTDNYTATSAPQGSDIGTEYKVNSNTIYIGIPGHETYICERDGVTYNIVNWNGDWLGMPAESFDFTIQGTLLSIVTDIDTFDMMRFDSTKGCYRYVFNDAPVQGGMNMTRSGIYEFYFVDGIIAAIVLVDEENETPQIAYITNVGTTEAVQIPDFMLMPE